MWAAFVTAIATILVSALTFSLTKRAERQAIWRAKKLQYYEEFFAATSGIVGGGKTDEAKARFSKSVNNLHLVGSPEVIVALHDLLAEIAESNANKSRLAHDRLWSALVWHIRADLDDRPSKDPSKFAAILWDAGNSGSS